MTLYVVLVIEQKAKSYTEVIESIHRTLESAEAMKEELERQLPQTFYVDIETYKLDDLEEDDGNNFSGGFDEY